MPNCTTNFTWYLGKFIIGFTGLLYLYANFWKEREKKCMCDVRLRELLKEKNEETQNDIAPVSNDFIKPNKPDSKNCYARRNSF